MRILLIKPAWFRNGLYENCRLARIPPLNLGVLAALSEGHEVRIVDEDVEDILYDEHWDLVGITAATSVALRAYKISDKFRSLGATVVIGGIHASLMPDEVLLHADAVVIGEAENIWPVLLSDFPGLEKKYYGGVVDDLDRTPFPRRDLFHPSYICDPIQITRGCVNRCAYCYLQSVPWKEHRKRSPRLVEEEISGIRKKHILVVDDNLFVDREYVLEIAQRIKPYKKFWGIQAPIETGKDRALVSKLAASGLSTVNLGIDSFIKESLAAASKSQKYLYALKEIIKTFHEHGIGVGGMILFGFEGETKEVFKRSLDNINSINMDSCSFFALTPIPGTKMYKDMEKQGRILTKDWSRYNGLNAVFEPSGMSKEELKTGIDQMYSNVQKQFLRYFYRRIPVGVRMFLRSPKLLNYAIDYAFLNYNKTGPE